ncbi:hypothetical protein GCM10018966_093740 [Streptomyces yanii]
MDVVAYLPADPQAAQPVQVGERALHDPALGAKAGAVLGTAAGPPPSGNRAQLVQFAADRFPQHVILRTEPKLPVAPPFARIEPHRSTHHIGRLRSVVSDLDVSDARGVRCGVELAMRSGTAA